MADDQNNFLNDPVGAAAEGDCDTNVTDKENTPSTVLILLGSMHFEHAGSVDVLSIKIATPEDRMEILEDASKRVAPNTIEALHVVLKSSSISSLFDESLFSTFYDGLIPGTGEVMVHVLPESSAMAEDMAVQADDVDAVRMGLVMTGYRLESEQQQDGSWVLSAKKPGPDVEDVKLQNIEAEDKNEAAESS
jgi:hypothetical protein